MREHTQNTMQVELYPYQKKAIEQLDSGKVLYAGVGTGKSLTALSYYIQKESSPELYIITTPKKRNDCEWEKEATRLNMDLENVFVDSWNNIHHYLNIKNAFFIFDEQRAVGNGTWADSFVTIAKNNRWIMLTATPGDTWMDYIPLFLANRYYKNRTEFYNTHVIFNQYVKFPQVKAYVNTGLLQKHKSDILVEMVNEDLRRPTKNVKEWIVSYDKTLYDIITQQHWDPWEEKPIKNASQFCSCQRRICNESPDKVAVLKLLMERHPKAIIFYNFNHELEILKNACKEIGVSYSQYNGDKHEPIPETDRWAYLVQYTAGAEGWNCVLTDTIIFYSKSPSYKAMTQAAGRIDRLNTKFTDLYYYYIKTDSDIDKRIDKILKNKKEFNVGKWYKEQCKLYAPFNDDDPLQAKFEGF